MSTFSEKNVAATKTDDKAKKNPLDHDGDGKPGGSKPATPSTQVDNKGEPEKVDEKSAIEKKSEPDIKVQIVDPADKAPATSADEGQGLNASNLQQKEPVPQEDRLAPTEAEVGQHGTGTVIDDEKPIGDITDEATQSDSYEALDAADLVAPVDPFQAYEGPDAAGIVRKEDGTPVYAPPGSKLAANMGVQQDASGHFSSAHTNNGDQSGTRV